MAVKNKRSSLGLLLLLGVFFLIGIFISFSIGSVQRSQDTRSRADVAPLVLSFSQEYQSSDLFVSLDASSHTGMRQAEVSISFDKTVLELRDEITTHASLSVITSKSTKAQANSSGVIQFTIALPSSNVANPLLGTFELAKFPFQIIKDDKTANRTITLASTSKFKDSALNVISYTTAPLTLTFEGAYCGGIQGTACPADYTCMYSNGSPRPPHADASGTCESDTPKTTITATPTATLHPTVTPSSTPTPTIVDITITPTPTDSSTASDSGIIANPPSWWWIIPAPLRNFLEQLYVWVFIFRQPTGFMNLLEGLPTPTP